MRTIQLDAANSAKHVSFMQRLAADPAVVPAGMESVEVERDVAMLLEPLNGHAYVFVPPSTVHQFPCDSADPVERLRMRMNAGLFLSRLADEQAHQKHPVGASS